MGDHGPQGDGAGRPLPDPILKQIVFDVAWDIRSAWRKGEPASAADYGEAFGEDFARPEVRQALREAEELARFESVLGQAGRVRFDRPAAGFQATPPPGVSWPWMAPSSVPGEIGRLGHFRLQGLIGRGATGWVFEASVDGSILEKRRALKVIDPAIAMERAAELAVREAQALSGIVSGNVVRVHAAGQAGGVAYIEMEYVHGPTLRDLLSHHGGAPLPLRPALDLVRQAAAGLAAIHSANPPLAHRDIKPNNLLLERSENEEAHPFGWRLRVCDLGIADLAGDLSPGRGAPAWGTPAYLAPELLGDGPVSDRQPGDIFALGIIAWELATGQHPFRGGTDEETLARIRACRPGPFRRSDGEIPERIGELVLGMLDASPGGRPAAREVAESLDRVLAPSGIKHEDESVDKPRGPSMPHPEKQTSPKTSGMRRWAAWTASVVMVLTLAAAAVGWWLLAHRGPSQEPVEPRSDAARTRQPKEPIALKTDAARTKRLIARLERDFGIMVKGGPDGPFSVTLDPARNQDSLAEALEALAEVGKVTELAAGCPERMDLAEFGRMPDLKKLDLATSKGGKGSLAFLKSLPRLQALSLKGWTGLRNVDGLDGMASLSVLNLDGCKDLRYIEGLRTLSGLKELSMASNTLEDVSALKGLTSLKKLTIAYQDNLASVDSLAKHPSLEVLVLRDVKKLDRVEALRGLPRLEKLTLDGCGKLEAVDLEGMPRLLLLQLRLPWKPDARSQP